MSLSQLSSDYLMLRKVGLETSTYVVPLGRSTHGNSMFFRKKLIEEIGGFRYDTALEKETLKRGKRS